MAGIPRAMPIALVTGASSGVGQHTARRFAEQGFRVFGTSRRDRPDWLGVEMLRLDVHSQESVQQCVDEALTRAGQIDVLVNNAGAMHEGFAEETTMPQAAAVFETNFFGTVRVINAVLPGMRRRRTGRIINVGSLAAWVGEPGEAFYAASKAALARYTEALHHEVWPLGLTVSLVEPGAFATDVVEVASRSDATIADYNGLRESASDTLRRGLRRGGDPRDLASLIVRIAQAQSPKARYGAGLDGRWLPSFKVLSPQRLFDYLLRRGYGLPSPAQAPPPR